MIATCIEVTDTVAIDASRRLAKQKSTFAGFSADACVARAEEDEGHISLLTNRLGDILSDIVELSTADSNIQAST